MSENLSAAFDSYQKAEEAANKLLAIRAAHIGISLADAPSGESAAAGVSNGAGSGAVPAGRAKGKETAGWAHAGETAESASDMEMSDELPPYHGSYRLTAHVPPDVRELAERIVRSCAGRLE